MSATTAPAGTRRPYLPALPRDRGRVSGVLLDALRLEPGSGVLRHLRAPADPYGDDLQLALYVCYELHYRSFRDVAGDWEWDPDLLRLRRDLERVFLTALRAEAPRHYDAAGALDDLLVEPIDVVGVSHHLRTEGTWPQLREYVAHRSVYHLKEADPHAWVIPRLEGRAKAALVAVEYDEFGAGRADRVHATLFADLMRGMGLDDRYGHYVDAAPASMLAVVNLMSLTGLHRSLRGALVGHFAAAEITTPPTARRMAQALQRLGAGPECVEFYTEHVEADAVHEQVMRHDVVEDLLAREPELEPDVVLGVDATVLLEDRYADDVLAAWRRGRPASRRHVSV
ncbi:MAG: iron-containing redox enzyme family protein [Streptosporangiales bacterium]|nr:iron-containing redox enzyme family protein [Streptosporangiales bacterium]